MSKRRSKSKSPNIPLETLERARRQAAGEAVDAQVPSRTEQESAAPADTNTLEKVPGSAASTPSVSRSSTSRAERRAQQGVGAAQRRRSSTQAAIEARQRRRVANKDELTHEQIEEILMNPTKTVTEETLHEAYGYVLTDLRNMGVLAALLFVVLIAAALVIV